MFSKVIKTTPAMYSACNYNMMLRICKISLVLLIVKMFSKVTKKNEIPIIVYILCSFGYAPPPQLLNSG